MRLPLVINGEEGWLDVKDRLKVIDERKRLDFSVDGYDADGTPRVGIGRNAVARAAARIKSWHLPETKPIPVGASFETKVALIDDLYPDAFKAIATALSLFEEEQEKAAIAKAAVEKAAEASGEENPTPDGAIA